MKRTHLTLLGSVLIIGFAGVGCLKGQESYDQARARMVREQILDRGVRDSLTLRAMRSVPRHAFVPSSVVAFAYEDHPLPIGYGQTISQPYIVALMTEMIDPGNCSRVLEVGTGSGYQAAVLAEIVDSVFTIEIVPELAASARDRLYSLGYRNVSVRSGDGYLGWPEHAPFDAIIVTAAPDHIPQPLVDQLRDRGTMVIPVGPAGSIQELTRVRKVGGVVKTEITLPVQFVPLIRRR
jgi:protein-L-isoaspartate(D-aspartate) O-methyltransferase